MFEPAINVTAEIAKWYFLLNRRSEWENKNTHGNGPILRPFIRLGFLGRPRFHHTPEYTLVRHWSLILRVEFLSHLSRLDNPLRNVTSRSCVVGRVADSNCLLGSHDGG